MTPLISGGHAQIWCDDFRVFGSYPRLYKRYLRPARLVLDVNVWVESTSSLAEPPMKCSIYYGGHPAAGSLLKRAVMGAT